MATFALIHGAAHGAWCYDLLASELVRLGHAAIAMDTPVEDTTVGLREHAAAVATAVAAADVQRPLVVVAHSAGGAFLPIAASACGAQAMIFLCAVVPVEGLSGVDQRGLDGSMVTMPAERFDRDDLGRTLAPPDFARDYYYDDCCDYYDDCFDYYD